MFRDLVSNVFVDFLNSSRWNEHFCLYNLEDLVEESKNSSENQLQHQFQHSSNDNRIAIHVCVAMFQPKNIFQHSEIRASSPIMLAACIQSKSPT